MADSSGKLKNVALNDVSDDEEEVALVTAAEEQDGGEAIEGIGKKSEAQMNGVLVLTLLDKIIGVVDQIQQTQNGLEERQQDMEKSVAGIRSELAKLNKRHIGTNGTVNKMLDKVRKVNVNVKTVRSTLEKQALQVKRLEKNESELLKRRNFKVLIYPEQLKTLPEAPEKDAEEALEVTEEAGPEGEEEAGVRKKDQAHTGFSSSDDEVEIEEIIEESRAQRIKRSGMQRMDNIKKAFSKEKMEKTRQRTRENLEKTRQRTRDNLEKTRQRTRENLEKTRQRTQENLEKTRKRTRENFEKTKHNLEKKMGNLSTRISAKSEQKEKSMTPDKNIHGRSKTAVYRVPPFTFYVKKIREGEVEVHATEEEAVGGEGKQDSPDTAQLLSEGSPVMQALMEAVEESELVLVEQDRERDSD